MPTTQAEPAAKASVTLVRLLDASPAQVWRAWTDPKALAVWWGPHTYTNPVCEVDLRPGGEMKILMRATDGAEHLTSATFREVVTEQRLVFTMAAVGDDGVVHLDGITTVTFEAEGAGTRLTVRADAIGHTEQSVFMLGGMEAGWSQSLERLEALLAKR